MAMLFKTKASSLAKVNALPVFRNPADLYNQFALPYDIQKKQVDGEINWKEGKYYSNPHYQLSKFIASSRKQYRSLVQSTARQALANKQFIHWKHYLSASITNPATKLSEQQKQQIYEAMLTAKERNQERLALSRFIKFGYQYSQAYKVDLPLNPVVIMKLVHPHFGYLNHIPNHNQYKYTYQQIFTLIEQFNAVSLLRDKGYILHSSELLSFVFWKILSLNNARLPASKFVDLLKVFKFNNVTEQTLKDKFSYSIKEGETVEGDGLYRFDVFRQIFLDREL